MFEVANPNPFYVTHLTFEHDLLEKTMHHFGTLLYLRCAWLCGKFGAFVINITSSPVYLPLSNFRTISSDVGAFFILIPLVKLTKRYRSRSTNINFAEHLIACRVAAQLLQPEV